jgi:hypothetical protein
MSEDIFAAREQEERETGPAQIIDCLQGFIDRGEVQDLIVVMEGKDTTVHLWATDMRKTEIVGLLEFAKLGWAHEQQHIFEDEEEVSE